MSLFKLISVNIEILITILAPSQHGGELNWEYDILIS